MNHKKRGKDLTLYCDRCNGKFLFSAEEQQFYFEKGYTHPKHCRECRGK